MTKVLFILKYREVSDPEHGVYSYTGLSSGLFNSARMVSEMLNAYGLNGEECESKLVQVIDNNCIDREVTAFCPDVVIIEAIWVVPEKFEVLRRLHPKVKWLIRNHSNIPFLAQEGQTLGWITQYVKEKNVYVGTNTKASLSDLKVLGCQRVDSDHYSHIQDHKVVYFPNYYMTKMHPTWTPKPESNELHIGCFGAIRPLKNQLEQAVAAIKYGKKVGKHIYFHINAGRAESGGMPIVKNLRNLFADSKTSTLVEHSWIPHAEFVKLVGTMDLSLQVSFSETFNIVTADAVQQGVPVVGSPEVMWISPRYWADPVSSDDIVEKMWVALHDAKHGYHNVNQESLAEYNAKSHRAISDTILKVLHHHDHHIEG